VVTTYLGASIRVSKKTYGILLDIKTSKSFKNFDSVIQKALRDAYDPAKNPGRKRVVVFNKKHLIELGF